MESQKELVYVCDYRVWPTPCNPLRSTEYKLVKYSVVSVLKHDRKQNTN